MYLSKNLQLRFKQIDFGVFLVELVLKVYFLLGLVRNFEPLLAEFHQEVVLQGLRNAPKDGEL